VRLFLVICLWCGSLVSARAQDQEGKLVDRLLRPDMGLQSTEQHKKFLADRVSLQKRAHVSTFYLQQKSNSKAYTNTRDFSTRRIDSRSFEQRKTRALLFSRTTTLTPTYATGSSSQPRGATDAGKKVGGGDFAGNRPFLTRGKSQDSLDQQNPPMTVEQVRELLNKNK
jgi:hypothetical protein